MGDEWKPEVKTDSRALEWMNQADFTAVLEEGDGGPTVRIFAETETIGKYSGVYNTGRPTFGKPENIQ